MGSAPLRHWKTGGCALLLILGMVQLTYAQMAKRSGTLPFRQYVNPTDTSKKRQQSRAEQHNEQLRGASIVTGNGAASGQRPWESQDGPLGAQTMEDTEIIARVGPEVILAASRP